MMRLEQLIRAARREIQKLKADVDAGNADMGEVLERMQGIYILMNEAVKQVEIVSLGAYDTNPPYD